MGQRAAAARAYWEIWQGNDSKWYFHLKATNHERVTWGEGYYSKASAKEAVVWVKYWAAKATGP
jgi:uncharacterized protein YegP (UPF0339 family)